MDARDLEFVVFHGFVGFGLFGFVGCFRPQGFFFEAVGMELCPSHQDQYGESKREGEDGKGRGGTLTFVRASKMGSRTGILSICIDRVDRDVVEVVYQVDRLMSSVGEGWRGQRMAGRRRTTK